MTPRMASEYEAAPVPTPALEKLAALAAIFAAIEPRLLVAVERRLLRGMHLLPGCKLLLLLGNVHLRALALLKHHLLLLS